MPILQIRPVNVNNLDRIRNLGDNSKRRLNVLVLGGGLSIEREVSEITAKEVVKALTEIGHAVTVIDVGSDFLTDLTKVDPKPDVIFNALHGRFGEDGRIQGVLDYYGVPYTHSGVSASAVAMNKHLAKSVMADAGLPLARHRLMLRSDIVRADPDFPMPFVIKPIEEGSALGVYIIHSAQDIEQFRAAEWPYADMLMVEEYVPGKELSVPVIDGRAMAAIGIVPCGEHSFYTYESKYAEGGSNHIIPADIHPEAAIEARSASEGAYLALGCRGVARVDLRYDDTQSQPGRIVVLEVNTQPGLTPTSLVPDGARAEGMEFGELLQTMLELAMKVKSV